ncbi:MAG: tetratricopeptide repeat protein [Verrucomicrobia bacterium]|nr:tetratricopeptide repeat protein [Verrucomicrobiota bacterium]
MPWPIRIGIPAALLVTGFGLWLFRGEAIRPSDTPDAAAHPDLFQLEDGPAVFARYGGSASCRECHEEAYQLWRASNHGLAERIPLPHREDPAFVPAQTFQHASQQTTVRKDGDRYEVFTLGLGGSNGPFVVERVIGNNPLVQFLTPFPGGRWQTLEASWDPVSNEWFNVYGQEDRQPGEWGHWTGRGMNWNSMCAVCHNTRVRKHYDPAADTYHTTMAERTVGCEACHGPMKDHVEWQRKFGDKVADPTIRKLTREQMFHTCASCHSRRMEITGDFHPGEAYDDHHLLGIVDETDTWYPDGQNWDEDYEYTAFLGSRMHLKGVRCVDCHDFHSAKVRMTSNWMCLACHAVGTTNAIQIDPVKHSFHSETNSGNLCTGCHLPQTPYMQRHWRHDHGFTIPDPVLTKEFNIPNACNRCHKDRTVEWSIEYVKKWYGAKMDRPYRQRARIVARAKRLDAAAVEPLLGMLATNEIPYWRAVAAGMLDPWIDQPRVAGGLLGALVDTNALVRVNVIRTLAPLAAAGHEAVRAAFRAALDDPVRGVRFQAASALRGEIGTNSLARSELWYSLQHNADQPVGQMQLGSYFLARGDTAGALRHYETAVQWDAYSPALRHELAVVLSMVGRTREAVEQLREAIRLAPNEAEYHYKIALALNESGDVSGTRASLAEAVRLNPAHGRAWYNLGLARAGVGEVNGAVDALLRAETLLPNDPHPPYALATVLAQAGDLSGAREAAQRALNIGPGHQPAAALLRMLESGRSP